MTLDDLRDLDVAIVIALDLKRETLALRQRLQVVEQELADRRKADDDRAAETD